MKTPDWRFRQICSELGWGDAEKGLWFIGIEERAGFEAGEEPKIERLYDHHQFFRDDAVEAKTRPPGHKPVDGRSQSSNVESKIAAPLSTSTPTWVEFRKRIFHNRSRVAHANLFPLGKPKAASPLPECYFGLFGFGPGASERRRYEEAVAQFRFTRLRLAVRELRPQAIVCMGKGYWWKFREALDLHSEGQSLSGGKLLVHVDERVILAPHFARNHLNSKLQAQITALLKDWGIKLP